MIVRSMVLGLVCAKAGILKSEAVIVAQLVVALRSQVRQVQSRKVATTGMICRRDRQTPTSDQ